MFSAKKNNKKLITSRINNKKVFFNNGDKNSYENIEESISVIKQQKFNFDSKKTKIEDGMDNSFFDENSNRTIDINKSETEKPISVKVEDVSIQNAMKKGKEQNDSIVVTMLFFAIIIALMRVFFGIFDCKVGIEYKKVEVVPENIVFLGDSLTNFYDLKKYYPKRNVVNSGIGGNRTTDILSDMENRVYRYNPSHVILLIGINDLNENSNTDDIANNIKKIVKGIEKHLPKTKIYLESLYPINSDKLERSTPFPLGNKSNKNIKKINENIKKFSKKEKIKYINMYDELTDKNGHLKLSYTKDGLHLNDKGYKIVTSKIKKVLNI